jgi:hypothetical protein
MKTLSIALFAGASILALATTSASAAIVCNDEGDCWHVKAKHEYKPEFSVRVYNDDWKWTDNDSKKYRWREPEGDDRGYWRKGVWIGF